MVVFEGGAPKKSDYRKFRIRGDRSGGPDDFASMEEVLARRARSCSSRPTSRRTTERDESFASLPDLILIDGGKGQLSAGMRVLAPLAERGCGDRPREAARGGLRARPLGPLPIPRRLRGLRLLQRVRDEAHRFAIEHHRAARPVDDALAARRAAGRRPGAKAGAPHALRLAGALGRRQSREELEAVPGIPGKLARDIHRQLNRTG